MSTNLLSNVGLFFNVCEKSPRNTKVTGTITGAVPWTKKSVFPELNRPPRYCTRRRNGRCTFPMQPFLSPPSSSRPLPLPLSSSSSSLLRLLRPPHPFPPPPPLFFPVPPPPPPPLTSFGISFPIASPLSPPSPGLPTPTLPSLFSDPRPPRSRRSADFPSLSAIADAI